VAITSKRFCRAKKSYRNSRYANERYAAIHTCTSRGRKVSPYNNSPHTRFDAKMQTNKSRTHVLCIICTWQKKRHFLTERRTVALLRRCLLSIIFFMIPTLNSEKESYHTMPQTDPLKISTDPLRPRTLRIFDRDLNRYDDVWKCAHYNWQISLMGYPIAFKNRGTIGRLLRGPHTRDFRSADSSVNNFFILKLWRCMHICKCAHYNDS
jgi:hypothetical protein